MPVFRFRVIGKEEVPMTEGVILAANHVSYVDPVFIGVALVERQLHFMAKEELFRFPVFGAVIRRLHAFPVRRGEVDHAAIRQCLHLLEKGEILLMFPEGTRGDGITLRGAERGVGLLAVRSGCPVVPVYVCGTDHVLPRGKRMLRFRPVTVYFGRAVRPPVGTVQKASRWNYRQLTDQVMKGIGELRDRAHASEGSVVRV